MSAHTKPRPADDDPRIGTRQEIVPPPDRENGAKGRNGYFRIARIEVVPMSRGEVWIEVSSKRAAASMAPLRMELDPDTAERLADAIRAATDVLRRAG